MPIKKRKSVRKKQKPKPAFKTRLLFNEFPGREFDIEFWQEQGDDAIFAAVWEMICFAHEFKYGKQPAFQGAVTKLNSHKVQYMIVGGYAVIKYTEPRYTKDLDIWVRASPQNAKKLYAALADFGAPLTSDRITPDVFSKYGVVYQIGRPPLRIDIITKISGVSFGDAWRRKKRTRMAGKTVYVIGLEDLMRNKEAAGRDSDLLDLKTIKKYLKPTAQ